jgi:hypothetical protein
MYSHRSPTGRLGAVGAARLSSHRVGMNACIERVVLSSLQVHLLYIFELEGVNLLEVLHQDPE